MLLAARRIILIDPNYPDWHHPLHSELGAGSADTLSIPIDSCNAHAIRDWIDHIRELGLDD